MSSSVTVRVTASGAVTAVPVTVAEMATAASAASTSLSTAVTLTVPLSVPLAGMVSVVPPSVTLPEGEAASVTVVAEDTALGSVAFTVVALPDPLSAMLDEPSTSDTLGFVDACGVAGPATSDCGLLPCAFTARMRNRYSVPLLRLVTV